MIRGYLFRKNREQFFESRRNNLESEDSSYKFSPIKTKIKYANNTNSEDQNDSSDGFK